MEKSSSPIIKNKKVSILTKSALFAAIATLLMYVEFPLPFMPPFLKVDLSGVAILIAAFMFGPLQAIGITLVKDLVHLLSTKTGGVGELADFLVLSFFAVVAGMIYAKHKDKKHALLGSVLGTVAITIAGALANKFLLIPFYSQVMPIDAIVSVCGKINPLIGDINTYILFGAAPFNLIKGIILSICTFLLYKRLSNIIHKI
ncbi:MAG: ECF transporter S component [Oscillospiraceae bacterium]